jgi:hypothetical protein
MIVITLLFVVVINFFMYCSFNLLNVNIQSPLLGNNLMLNFNTSVKNRDLMLMKMIFIITTVISLIKQVSSQFLSQWY